MYMYIHISISCMQAEHDVEERPIPEACVCNICIYTLMYTYTQIYYIHLYIYCKHKLRIVLNLTNSYIHHIYNIYIQRLYTSYI